MSRSTNSVFTEGNPSALYNIDYTGRRVDIQDTKLTHHFECPVYCSYLSVYRFEWMAGWHLHLNLSHYSDSGVSLVASSDGFLRASITGLYLMSKGQSVNCL